MKGEDIYLLKPDEQLQQNAKDRKKILKAPFRSTYINKRKKMNEEPIHNTKSAKKTKKVRKRNQKNEFEDTVTHKIGTRSTKAQPEEQHVMIARRRCGFEQ